MKRIVRSVVLALSISIPATNIPQAAAAASTPTYEYVLWSKSATGQASLWKINPSDGSIISSAWLRSAAGVGAGWQAVSYTPISDSEGYVLWTKSSTGQSSLWKVNPANGSIISSAWLRSAAGVGAGWQAMNYSTTAGGAILNSTSDPTLDVGKDGDFFINTATATIFGPKTTAGWDGGTALVGPQGPKGDNGEPGPPGILRFYTTQSAQIVSNQGNNSYVPLELSALCEPGDQVTGGGFEDGVKNGDAIKVYSSKPTLGSDGWVAYFSILNNGIPPGEFELSVWARCADMTP